MNPISKMIPAVNRLVGLTWIDLPVPSRMIWGLAAVLFLPASSSAAEQRFVDVRTVMRLAGANNDEIERARLQHLQAIAESKQTWQRFWPSPSLEAGYKGYDGRIQNVEGAVFDVEKEQYTVGAAVVVDWSPGDLYYEGLVSEQRVSAAAQLEEKARRDVVLEAVERYYDLLSEEAALALVTDILRSLRSYEREIAGAVTAGTALRTEVLRVKGQVSRSQLEIRKIEEMRDLKSAALAETLRLAPDSKLRPAKSDLVPVSLLSGNESGKMIELAQTQRPEILAAGATTTAADLEEKRSRVAPLIPSLKARYNGGGLGGGADGNTGNFGDEQDSFVGLSWKIGPGGLFDKQRKKIAGAKLQVAEHQSDTLKAAVGREVVEALARSDSAEDQLSICNEAVSNAEEMVALTRQRQASEVGVVLDYLLANDELIGAQRSRLEAINLYNKAQHALMHAVGIPSSRDQK